MLNSEPSNEQAAAVSQPADVQLPSLRAWGDLNAFENPEWFAPWEHLRLFFSQQGYDLFRPYSDGRISAPNVEIPPAIDSFDLYGDRENFESGMGRFPLAFAARDRNNRDVVIKLIAKGDDGLSELKILRSLNSEPLKSDPANLTVRVLEFLTFGDCHFAVMPFCDGFDESPFFRASECLDFVEQILSTLTFLHSNHIAHLDISHENILMNCHGKIPDEFRRDFPVEHWIIDFGYSVQFEPGSRPQDRLIEPVAITREQRAPEMDGRKKIDPFAADVYATALVFYADFQDIVPNVPGFLELLQDMSSFNPTHRLTAAAALDRLKALRSCIPAATLSQTQTISYTWYKLVPRGFWRMLFEIISTGQVWLACRFMWTNLPVNPLRRSFRGLI